MDRLWLTWENQRRSRELAEFFDCCFRALVFEGWLRYPRSIVNTLVLLLRNRPRILFVQNPSMVLAAVAVLWGMLTKTFVVVDRHTTFLLNREDERSLWLVVFKTLHHFTLRHADITVVTNDHLAGIVLEHGGRPFVLQDKLPEVDCDPVHLDVPEGTRTVLFICSFADDEPIKEVFEALRLGQGREVRLYVSGNPARASADLLAAAPSGVTFTGFLPDEEYLRLLCSVDMVLVLTTADYTMLCGCYEAFSAGKPLVTTNKDVLHQYFDGAVFVDNSPAAIAEALAKPDAELREISDRIQRSRAALHEAWIDRASRLDQLVGSGARGQTP